MGQKEGTEKASQTFFARMFAHVWDGFLLMVERSFPIIWDGFKAFTRAPSEARFRAWAQRLVDRKMIDQDTANMIGDIESEPFPNGLILEIMLRMTFFRHEVESIMSVYDLDRQYDRLSATTPNPAPVDALIRSMIIDPGRTTDNRRELGKHGYNTRQIDNMILGYYRTVDENTLRMCYLRGVISNDRMYERMRELGYTDQRISEIVQTWELLPGPQDLFTMVAHEAFEPAIYRPLGLDQEFPTEQIEWLKKQGISEDWARKYWISHWEQPSIEMGFEMLHRGVIDSTILDMLFKTVEIPTYWRDKLTAIAYSPFTRVDVRRMHKIGVLDDQELIRSYMDLGYSGEKALKMAQFTVKYNAESEEQLTRSTILSSYEKSLISRRDAKELLLTQDYSETLAEYYLTFTDYKRESEVIDVLFDNVRERFLLHQISQSQARIELNKMGLLGEKIDALLENWQLQTYKYERLPSLTDLTGFMLSGIISEIQFRQVMSQHGFNTGHINWYIEAINSPEAASPRLPSRTDIGGFLKKKIISQDQWREQMKLLRYEDKYIDWYLQTL